VFENTFLVLIGADSILEKMMLDDHQNDALNHSMVLTPALYFRACKSTVRALKERLSVKLILQPVTGDALSFL
jgi:hypothetical protein